MQNWYFRLVKLNFNSNLTQNFIIFLCVTERVSQSLTKIIAVTQSLDDFIHRNRTILITRSPCWFQSSVNLVNFIHRLLIQPNPDKFQNDAEIKGQSPSVLFNPRTQTSVKDNGLIIRGRHEHVFAVFVVFPFSHFFQFCVFVFFLAKTGKPRKRFREKHENAFFFRFFL